MKDIKDNKVSIVVAIYNVAPYLDKLIHSLVKQTYQNIEIILVDDGSPDESGSICDSYAKQDSRIIVLHKSNGGGCEARNMGMELATGKYITFVDGDDWVEPDYIEYLLNIMLFYNADMALTDSVFTTRDTQQNITDDIENWTPERAASAIVRKEFPVGCWNKMYSLEMVRKHQLDFNVPWSGEGLYFATMAAQYSNSVAKGHKRIYNYRQNNPTSCLTAYDVKIGINALWNIKNIGKISIIRSPRFMHAVEWHIWENYGFLLRLIAATNSRKKYLWKYLKCRLMVCVLLPRVIRHNDYSKSQIKSMIKHVLLPDWYARKTIKMERELLAKDMEKPQII